MNRGRSMLSALAGPLRTLAMQGQRMPRKCFPAAHHVRAFSVAQADLEKLSILRKSIADEFDVDVTIEGVSSKPLDDNPNYDYIFEALKHDPEGHQDTACLHDTLATFAAIDEDRSGYLDKNELRKAMSVLVKNDISDQELDTVFDKMDLNHDGKISFFEFEEGIKTLTAQADMD